MPESTIILDTQYYQKLCELIAEQEKIIDLYRSIAKQNDRETELKDKMIEQLQAGIELRDKTLVEYNRLKEMLKL